MPLCVKCGKPLACGQCGPEEQLGGIAKACGLKKGAVWVHVMDDRGEGVEGVEVALAGSRKTADGSGFVGFDPMDEGNYEASLVPLGGALAKKYDPPKSVTAAAPVANGEITYLAFGLTRRARLKVKVVKKGEHIKFFGDATVTVTMKGGGPQAKPTLSGDGIADFGDVSAGSGSVKVALAEEDAKGFFSPGELDFVISPGEVKTVPFEVEPIHVVTPTLTLKEPVGWHDGESAEHCVPAVLRLGLLEEPKPSPYAGRGHVEVIEGAISLFKDEECTTQATSFSAEELRAGQPVYVKGAGAGKGRVKLRLDDAEDPVRVVVKGPAEEAVEIKPVNVVTPVIELEYNAVLLDKGLGAHQAMGEAKVLTSATRVEVSLTETVKDRAFGKGALLTSASADVEIYVDADCKTAHDPNAVIPYGELTDTVKKKALYLKGKAAGEVKLTLKPEAKAEAGFRVVEKAEKTVVVVKLDLEVHAHADATPHAEAALSDDKKVKDGRVLHAQNAGEFGRAKLVVKKPDAKLWTGGGIDYKVVVSVHADTGAVALYGAAAGGVAIAKKEVDQAGFGGGDVTLWVEGTTAGKALHHARVDIGLDRNDGGLAKEIKRNGDWARFTVVKIAKVTPDTANYKQKVNQAASVGHPDRGPKYKSKATLSEKIAGIRLCFRVVAHEDNAYTLPDVWKHKNPDTPVHAVTDVNGDAEAEVELSGVDPNYKSGYDGNKFLVAAYVSGDRIADDPKRNDASPKYRVESQEIEIEAPALACPCCGVNPGHSAGYPVSMTDWYENSDFKVPPTASAQRVAYRALIADVNNRAANGCTCHGAGTHLVPYNPCNRFFRPVTNDEYNEIIRKWNNARKRVQTRLGIPTEAAVIITLTTSLGRPPTIKEVQDERQVNHLVPKGAGACPSNAGNLEANGRLCAYCKGLDARFAPIQQNRVSK